MVKTNFEIKKIIDELEKILLDEQLTVQSKITISAPQSFREDMNECARGMIIARNTAIFFLQEKLLEQGE